MKLQATICKLPVSRPNRAACETCNLFASGYGATAPKRSEGGQLSTRHAFLAFSLVEVLLVMTLLSLIILALMNVFSTTQAAFRASVTQTDILEGSRAAMQMITDDLRGLTPSGNTSNVVGTTINDSVNFFLRGK